MRLRLKIRRCHRAGCVRHLRPYRPEAEGRYALPKHEFGLDVVALVGALRYAEHRSVPEIRHHLVARGLSICERTVTNLHAKKELKKRVRGIRPLERQVESRTDPEAAVVRDYCSAVRSALTDDGRPPLAASGLKLQNRLSAIAASLKRAKAKGGFRPSCGS